jgi:hypothetical protein
MVWYLGMTDTLTATQSEERIPFTVDEIPPVIPDPSKSEDERPSRGRRNNNTEAVRGFRKPRKGSLVKPLTKTYASVGMLLLPFDEVCGQTLINSAEQCAIALDDLAQTNDTIARVLVALVETSAWGAVIAAHLPLLMVVASHHVPAFSKVQETVMEKLLQPDGEEQ